MRLGPAALATRMIRWGEGLGAGVPSLAALFALTVVLRNILESVPAGVLFPPEAFILHFPVAYVFPMLGITAAMTVLSGYDAGRILKLMVFAWTLTILPPLLDGILGTSSSIGYFPLDRSNAAHFLLNFFNPSVELVGTTAGIRIEAVAGCLLGGFYIGLVSTRARLARGIAGALLLAPLFLVFFSWPGLVNWAFYRFFPHTSTIQEFFQWHSLTRPHLTGSAHMTVFLVDAWPVLGLSAWLLHRIRPAMILESRARAAGWAPLVAAGMAGAAAAFGAARGGALTFADAATICGALLASILVIPSVTGSGAVAAACATAALLIGWAAGWPSLIAVMTALAAGRLPIPSAVRKILLAPVMVLIAASPVYSTAGAAAGALGMVLLAAALLQAAAAARGVLRVAPLLLPVIAIAFRPPPPLPGAVTAWHLETTDSFTRSGRNSHAYVSSALLAASGGPLLQLAESAHLSGRPDQAAWLCELSRMRGDMPEGMVKVEMNLALMRGERDRFLSLLAGLPEGAVDPGMLLPAVMRSAAAAGDTSMLAATLEMAGSSALFLNSWARALVVLGDTAGAAGFAAAALEAPDAGPSDYALAIDLSGMAERETGPLYEAGVARFPGSTEIMLAELRASIARGRPGEREQIFVFLSRTNPVSGEVLETCAAWLLEAGLPDSGLVLAERAAMISYPPSIRSLALAAACAEAAGDSSRAALHRRYLSAVRGQGLPPGEPVRE